MTLYRLDLTKVHDPVRAEQASVAASADSERAIAALQPAVRAGAASRDEVTVCPWIVDVAWARDAGIGQRTIVVVVAPMTSPPAGEDHVPEGCTLLRAEVFPASRFDSMTPRVRDVHRLHYVALMKWRRSLSIGKEQRALVPWLDFDPDELTAAAASWAAHPVHDAEGRS